ncbi:hypothetical protein ACFSJ3_08615 [Corallincola platygyrae]|uniref:Uncharacterized protein n=1 Tax=Corallincola platygyrae TaxID=1193278 RepID=A0ABW4XME9_9GAMM
MNAEQFDRKLKRQRRQQRNHQDKLDHERWDDDAPLIQKPRRKHWH